MRQLAGSVLVSAAVAMGPLPVAAASCQPSDITAITFAGTALPPYSPFVTFAPKLVTVTVSALRSCAVEIAFLTPGLPAKMSGAGLLTYDVQLPSTAASLLFTGAFPVTTAHIDIGAGLIGSTSVQVAISPNQIVADGGYSDASLLAEVFDKLGSDYTLLRSASLPLSGSVARACQFGSPGAPTLDFTAGIANGLPRAGYTQSLILSNINCTAPSTVRLSGSPMLLAQGGTSGPVFDNFIHYRASAVLSGASVVLDTSVAGDAISASRNIAVGSTTNGSLRLDVALVPGRPLMAGSYSSILTVSIDPNP